MAVVSISFAIVEGVGLADCTSYSWVRESVDDAGSSEKSEVEKLGWGKWDSGSSLRVVCVYQSWTTCS